MDHAANMTDGMGVWRVSISNHKVAQHLCELILNGKILLKWILKNALLGYGLNFVPSYWAAVNTVVDIRCPERRNITWPADWLSIVQERSCVVGWHTYFMTTLAKLTVFYLLLCWFELISFVSCSPASWTTCLQFDSQQEVHERSFLHGRSIVSFPPSFFHLTLSSPVRRNKAGFLNE